MELMLLDIIEYVYYYVYLCVLHVHIISNLKKKLLKDEKKFV